MSCAIKLNIKKTQNTCRNSNSLPLAVGIITVKMLM